jgi:hypothetical protein
VFDAVKEMENVPAFLGHNGRRFIGHRSSNFRGQRGVGQDAGLTKASLLLRDENWLGDWFSHLSEVFSQEGTQSRDSARREKLHCKHIEPF